MKEKLNFPLKNAQTTFNVSWAKNFYLLTSEIEFKNKFQNAFKMYKQYVIIITR